jgi:hypothetical protein
VSVGTSCRSKKHQLPPDPTTRQSAKTALINSTLSLPFEQHCVSKLQGLILYTQF